MKTAALNVSESTFESDVLERSRQVPVVVDFWAEWCGPCRALGPVLERLAEEADGSWILAKLDVDANQMLAAQFGIRGIPAVKAFKDGKEVAEFVGALPEPQVREWLAQLGPSPADLAVEKAERAEGTGDLATARSEFARAIDLDPGHGPARAGLARTEVALRAGDADEDSISKRLASDPSDVETALALADLRATQDRLDEAFGLLVDTVRITSGEKRDRARKHLLNLLELVPADDPRAMAARRSLSLALF
ncbi:MAG: thioredoxin [Actinomycetota bacterium]|nr:thioredoxin [Actinomycetota bacterium]